MSTTSAAHHERNRALSNGFCASIITPGVDLNDGLVFPANSSSSTPTTVSDYVETLRAARHHRTERSKTHWAPNLHRTKQNTTKAQGSPYLSRWIIHGHCACPGLAHQQNYPHRKMGPTKSYHMKVPVSPISQSAHREIEKAHIVIVALRLISHFSD
jgi:hypothetical protein